MGKYEIRPLSASRKADIVRTVLAEPTGTARQPESTPSTNSPSTNSPSRDTVNGMLNRAFRVATNR